MPYQSLHSPSKFRCLRKKNCCDCDWFLQWKNFPPTPLPGRRDDICRCRLCPTIFPHLSLWDCFPIWGFELQTQKYFLLIYILVSALKPDSGISIHVLCFNVCVLCFNVKIVKIKHLPYVSASGVMSLWMLEAEPVCLWKGGSNPRLPRRFLFYFGSTGSELDRMVPGSKVNILFKLMK